jgi:protein-glutamine gamma-glutamyltransferase
VLMRAAGIPARVVTGYQGGEINAVDGFMTVRQSDAHAWSEIWLPERGWLRVDPTAAVAPERVERGQAPAQLFGGLVTLDRGRANSLLSALRSIRQGWDAVNNSWNQWVLDYSSSRQTSLLTALGFDNPDWHLLSMLMAAVCLPLMFVIAWSVRSRPKIDPLQALYHRLCTRLAQWGYPRAPHEGPRAYRERLADQAHSLAATRRATATRFLESYEAARYAPPSGAPSFIRLRSLLAACR